MRPNTRFTRTTYQFGWKLRLLWSDLGVMYEDIKDWFAFRWGTPAVTLAEPFGAEVLGGRGQRLEYHVDEARPNRVAAAFLLSLETAEERRAVRRLQA